MTPLTTVIAFALGLGLGVFGGLLGIGGGVIAIPVLGLAYGMEQQLAQGTALVMIAPNVILGFWGYRRRFGIDQRVAATLAICAVPATYAAARFATGLDAATLREAFAIFIVALSIYYAYRAFSAARAGNARISGVGMDRDRRTGRRPVLGHIWRRRRVRGSAGADHILRLSAGSGAGSRSRADHTGHGDRAGDLCPCR